MPDVTPFVCDRPTGHFLTEPQASGPSRHRWTGPDGAPKVLCGYVARDINALLCHLLATHEMTLDKARQSVARRHTSS